jgi:hypothetical protein
MTPRNRLHTYTRWPADEQQRLDLAAVDLDFANVMRADGDGSLSIGDADALRRIRQAARLQFARAAEEK